VGSREIGSGRVSGAWRGPAGTGWGGEAVRGEPRAAGGWRRNDRLRECSRGHVIRLIEEGRKTEGGVRGQVERRGEGSGEGVPVAGEGSRTSRRAGRRTVRGRRILDDRHRSRKEGCPRGSSIGVYARAGWRSLRSEGQEQFVGRRSRPFVVAAVAAASLGGLHWAGCGGRRLSAEWRRGRWRGSLTRCQGAFSPRLLRPTCPIAVDEPPSGGAVCVRRRAPDRGWAGAGVVGLRAVQARRVRAPL